MNNTDRRPVIGITSSMNDAHSKVMMGKAYIEAVFESGGIPVLLPFAGGADAARRYFDSGVFDGFIFGGGVDINPARYGEDITGEGVEIIDERDDFELTLAELAKNTALPLLGICRGVQVINVAFGGTLLQNIPGHRQPSDGPKMPEPVTFVKGTLLHSLIGTDTGFVNSFHHQAVKAAAPGFTVSAVSDSDGIIEAVEPAERSERFILGVQWHPELFFHSHPSSGVIFRAFIDAAMKNMR